MLRSINSPPDPHDDHLRQLLDQRTARADQQGRFSALSQFDDTPSIYSPFLSPRPADNDHGSQLRSPTSSTFSARTHQERLNDPSASMLDLDDDPRRSIASDIFHDEQPSADDDNDIQRMSYLGPKMRFHSRAPWEMDGDTLEEEEEEEPDRDTLLPTNKKGFAFSSPRSSNASRPSGESTRSQAKSKQSFETTSSNISYPRGALYALAQESLSTSSLGTSAAGQKTLLRSESPNGSVPPSPISAARSPNTTPLHHLPPQHNVPDTETPPSSHRRPTYAADDFHPYANPDLVFSFADQGVSRKSVAHSSVSRPGTTSTLAPVTSMSSVNPRNRASTAQGKEISAHRLDSNFHPDEDASLMLPQALDTLPGWTDRGTSQTFSLISLEEARAQRMRSATAQPVTSYPSTSLSDAPSSVFFPDAAYDKENTGHSIDHTGPGPPPQRTRARSISAGAKAKNALHTIVGGGQSGSGRHEPDTTAAISTSGKTLKHKKSGFMRLFNGGRGQEKEEKAQPPPVPSLSDAYAAFNAQAVHKTQQITTHRIPVPQLSPSLLEASSSQGRSSLTLQPAAPSRPSPSPKRHIPPLSINTQPRAYAGRVPVSVTRTPWLNASAPQSAPANLRPFGDHIVNQDSRPSLETDVGTPGSSSNMFSPVTPGSAGDNKPSFMTPISEDQSAVISKLQDQIQNAKLAWQRQIWELEGQVRDLKAEIDGLRQTDSDKGYCGTCDRGGRDRSTRDVQQAKDLARTGTSSRFGSATIPH
ncbi:hypothetical protein FPV67DRAFT_1466341 [Lyophyllum atratum]|nr:hypothetical protein FPV67DRAFT_1466341 [Lyophyllum atratum]